MKRYFLLGIGMVGILLLFSCSPAKFYEKEIFFVNPRDHITLAGTLSIPYANHPVPAVILIHGSGPLNRDLDMNAQADLFKDLSDELASNGIAVLRYDKRGVGASQGNYIPYDMEHFMEDGLSGIDFLKSYPEMEFQSIGALGISQGGILTPLMAVNSDDIDFIILMAGAGVEAYELFYTSQLALAKAAGLQAGKEEKLRDLYDRFWAIISKPHLNVQERAMGLKYLKSLWEYIDMESRKDFGFLNENIEFLFDQMYHHPNVLKFFKYQPAETVSQVTCPVLALNGDKDVQVVAEINLPALELALKNGNCPSYQIVKLKNHNHLFQVCETGKVAEYKYIEGTVSNESLSIIKEWIHQLP